MFPRTGTVSAISITVFKAATASPTNAAAFDAMVRDKIGKKIRYQYLA